MPTAMSRSIKIRITLFLGILSWILFSFFDLYFIILDSYEISESFVEILPQAFLTLFILSILFYYRYTITKAESVNFLDLLWKVFITGLVTTIVSLLLRVVINVYSGTSFIQNPITVNFLYHVYVALVVIYLISTFVAWKRFILYQKSKNLLKLWNFFEYALILSLIFDFFGSQFINGVLEGVLVFLTSFALVLSFNLKWVAYLNFRQKWKTILFILLSGIYLYHFYLNLASFEGREAVIYDLLDRAFILALFVFIFIYATVSVLVTLFNLPTSSVFERKLREAVDFQKLSQSTPAGRSEEETYDVLIESSMSAVFADAAWLEIKQEVGTKIIRKNITGAQIREIRGKIKDEELKSIMDLEFSGNITQHKVFTSIQKSDFRSVFVLPILIKNQQVGVLVLLQEVTEAFNNEMVGIITTFVNQASITLENARLLDEAIENERYKEQLKIAKNVQKSLLPEQLNGEDGFSISAYSMAADEVGGDYYDIIKHKDELYSLIIGDVSGKGTSAAFNMAQMKGIFHSLGRQQLTPDAFMSRANEALSGCLEKSSFITASYYNISTIDRSIDFCRAGHCPTLLYNKEKDEATFLETKGMGLGILRNSEYCKYVYNNSMKYAPGDILLLHTDGITEAKDQRGVQFGESMLLESFLKFKDKEPEEIKEGIIDELYRFLNGKKLDDDYTLVIIKFN